MSKKMMNRVRFWGEASRIEELLKAVCYDGKPGTLDFGKQLPMPTALSHEEQLAWMQRNWGSQQSAEDWNAFRDGDVPAIRFYSDNRVMPIMAELAARFPDVEMDYVWSSSTMGENVGYAQYENGTMSGEYPLDDGSEEAYTFANDLWGNEADSPEEAEAPEMNGM